MFNEEVFSSCISSRCCVLNIDEDIVKHELFNPILPILKFNNVEKLLDTISETLSNVHWMTVTTSSAPKNNALKSPNRNTFAYSRGEENVTIS